MKTRIIVGLLIWLPVAAQAENYFTSGTIWDEVVFPNPPGRPDIRHKAWLQESEDPLQDALALYRQHDYEAHASLAGYIRTEGEKVYFSRPDTPAGEWYLMYDFGLELGESVEVYDMGLHLTDGEVGKHTLVYTSDCPEEWEVKDHAGDAEVMVMQSPESIGEEHPTYGYWVKGVGSLMGVLYNYHFLLDGFGGILLSVTNNGKAVFGASGASVEEAARMTGKWLKTSGMHISVESDDNFTVYNTQGQQIGKAKGTEGLTIPSHGIYIVCCNGNVCKVRL